MEFKINAFAVKEKEIFVEIEEIDQGPKDIDITVFDKVIQKMKEEKGADTNFFIQQLEMMKTIFLESDRTDPYRQRQKTFTIPIDKQIFKELDLKLEDKISLEIKKLNKK